MKKILHWIDENLELAFSSVCLVLMVLTVTIQVISRYVMKGTIPWTEEATRFLFIWMVFPAIGVCAKQGKHIRITLLPSKLPRKAGIWLDILSDLVFILLVCVLGYYSLEVVAAVQKAGQMSSVIPWLGRGHVYVIVPIGFALCLARLVQCVVLSVIALTKESDMEKEEDGK